MLHRYVDSSRYELNATRIAGTSAAIALHALVLMLLLAPSPWLAPNRVNVDPLPFIAIVDVTPKIVKTLAVEQPARSTQHEPKPATNAKTSSTAVPNETVISAPGTEVLVVDQVDHGEVGLETAAPSIAELSANIAPAPPYPALAVREGTTGRVLLRIIVDARGQPVEGYIEKTSGSRLLDKVALQFVLANWHFNPAMQGGMPVTAIALVPIEFTLGR